MCGGGGERGAGRRQTGHGVLGNMSASFDMVQPNMKISLCYLRGCWVSKKQQCQAGCSEKLCFFES